MPRARTLTTDYNSLYQGDWEILTFSWPTCQIFKKRSVGRALNRSNSFPPYLDDLVLRHSSFKNMLARSHEILRVYICIMYVCTTETNYEQTNRHATMNKHCMRMIPKQIQLPSCKTPPFESKININSLRPGSN